VKSKKSMKQLRTCSQRTSLARMLGTLIFSIRRRYVLWTTFPLFFVLLCLEISLNADWFRSTLISPPIKSIFNPLMNLKGPIMMRRYLVGMCKEGQKEGHTCDACELTKLFNDLQKAHKKNERKLEGKKKEERKKTGFEGRSCFRCFHHTNKLVEQNGTHQANCPYKTFCKDDKTSFCDECAIHEQFKTVQKKFCIMRRKQKAQEDDENSSAESIGSIPKEEFSLHQNDQALSGAFSMDQEMVLDKGQVEVSIQHCF
jgi:hypothetical protein